MADERTAPLDKQLVLPVTGLEFVLLVYIAHREGLGAHEWIRVLLTGAVRGELHAALRNELLGRIGNDSE